MNNDRDNLLNEYGVETFEEMADVEQDAPVGQDFEGMTRVALGDATFYLALPEKWAGHLGLLTKNESLTAAERSKLGELLRVLKTRRDVRSGDGQNCRREFLSALREREAVAANRFRQEVQKPTARVGEYKK